MSRIITNDFAIKSGFATKDWFRYNQGALLFLINNPLPKVRGYFRDKLGLFHHDEKIIISNLTPNAVAYIVDKDIFESTIYSGNRFEWNIKREFERLLMPFHKFDIKFANVFAPALNLGYDTLTAYSTTADGVTSNQFNTDFATTRNAATGTGYLATGTSSGTAIACYSTTGTSRLMRRSYFYFDTSSISTNTISAAVFSLYGVVNNGSSVSVQKGTQAATLAAADYDSFTGNSYGNTTGWSTTGYNDITLDATGLSDINKTGETKYCAREYTYDYLNSDPGDAMHANGCYYANQSGTTNDPKLVVTHAAAGGATFKPKIIFIN